MKWVGHVARIGERRGACKVFVGEPGKNTPLGRPSCVLEGNSGMDIKRPVGRMWTGMFWFLKLTSDGLLRRR
jgi:hypothetical protein